MSGRDLQRGALFDLPAARAEGEVLEILLGRPGVRIERIVSSGQTTPPGEWYDQTADEWVALLAGSAALQFDDGTRVEMAPGDWLLIPAHARHRVAATSVDPPCVWLAVHLPPCDGVRVATR